MTRDTTTKQIEIDTDPPPYAFVQQFPKGGLLFVQPPDVSKLSEFLAGNNQWAAVVDQQGYTEDLLSRLSEGAQGRVFESGPSGDASGHHVTSYRQEKLSDKTRTFTMKISVPDTQSDRSQWTLEYTTENDGVTTARLTMENGEVLELVPVEPFSLDVETGEQYDRMDVHRADMTWPTGVSL